MGDQSYDQRRQMDRENSTRREQQRLDTVDREKIVEQAMAFTLDGIAQFMKGTAALDVTPNAAGGMRIRLLRDPAPSAVQQPVPSADDQTSGD